MNKVREVRVTKTVVPGLPFLAMWLADGVVSVSVDSWAGPLEILGP